MPSDGARRAGRRARGGSLASSANSTQHSATGAIATANVRVPADLLGDARRGQRGDDRARVAGAGDAEHQALLLGRVPAAGQRERHREAAAGDRRAARRCRAPARRWCRRAQPTRAGSACSPRPSSPARFSPMRSTVEPRSRRNAEPPSAGTATMRPFCAGVRCRSLGDERAERAEQHPHHERHVEVGRARRRGSAREPVRRRSRIVMGASSTSTRAQPGCRDVTRVATGPRVGRGAMCASLRSPSPARNAPETRCELAWRGCRCSRSRATPSGSPPTGAPPNRRELLRRRGARVIDGPTIATAYLGSDERLRGATTASIARSADGAGGDHRHRDPGLDRGGAELGSRPRPARRAGRRPGASPGARRRRPRSQALGLEVYGDRARRADDRRAGAPRRARDPESTSRCSASATTPATPSRCCSGSTCGVTTVPVYRWQQPDDIASRAGAGARGARRPRARGHVHVGARGAQPVHHRRRRGRGRRAADRDEHQDARRVRRPRVRRGRRARSASPIRSRPTSAGSV